jgi:hypothetical protein
LEATSASPLTVIVRGGIIASAACALENAAAAISATAPASAAVFFLALKAIRDIGIS